MLVLICKTVVTKSSEQLGTPKYAELGVRIATGFSAVWCWELVAEAFWEFPLLKVANMSPRTVLRQCVWSHCGNVSELLSRSQPLLFLFFDGAPAHIILYMHPSKEIVSEKIKLTKFQFSHIRNMNSKTCKFLN